MTHMSDQRSAAGRPLRFVVQRHQSRRLHYDFRLEVNGVLASWAVPKGPSMNPADKRLAIRVENHPFAYGRFEGVIPKGEYGAGSVTIWDEGTYRLAEGSDPASEIRHGKLVFELHGGKLHGLFTLVKMHSPRYGGDAWLLIKDRDIYVKPRPVRALRKDSQSSVKSSMTQGSRRDRRRP